MKGVDYMNFRKIIASTTLSLFLLMPVTASANKLDISQANTKLNSCIVNSSEYSLEKSVRPESRLSPELKSKVKELKTQLKKGEISKEQFQQEIKNILPENSHFRHRKHPTHKKLNDADRIKLQELKTKLKNEEMSRKEFKKELKEIINKSIDIE